MLWANVLMTSSSHKKFSLVILLDVTDVSNEIAYSLCLLIGYVTLTGVTLNSI